MEIIAFAILFIFGMACIGLGTAYVIVPRQTDDRILRIPDWQKQEDETSVWVIRLWGINVIVIGMIMIVLGYCTLRYAL